MRPAPVARRWLLGGATGLALARHASAQAGRRVQDAAGRDALLPARIARVFPAGPPASILLFSLAPDLLAGWPGRPPPPARARLHGARGRHPARGRPPHRARQYRQCRGGARRPPRSGRRLRLHRPDLCLPRRPGAGPDRPAGPAAGRPAGPHPRNLPPAGRDPRPPPGRRRAGRGRHPHPRRRRTGRRPPARPRPTPRPLRPRPTRPGNRPRRLHQHRDHRIRRGRERRRQQPRRGQPGPALGRAGAGLGPRLGHRHPPGIPGLCPRRRGLAQPAGSAGRLVLAPSLPYGWVDFPPSINRLLGLLWLPVLFGQAPAEPLPAAIAELHALLFHRRPEPAQVEALLRPALPPRG